MAKFLCYSVEEGQGETKRSTLCLARSSACTSYQLLSFAPRKQRPTKRASLTVHKMQPDEPPLYLQQDRMIYQSIKERVSTRCEIFCCSTTVYEDKCLFTQSNKSLLNGIPKFVLKIGPMKFFINFTTSLL